MGSHGFVASWSENNESDVGVANYWVFLPSFSAPFSLNGGRDSAPMSERIGKRGEGPTMARASREEEEEEEEEQDDKDQDKEEQSDKWVCLSVWVCECVSVWPRRPALTGETISACAIASLIDCVSLVDVDVVDVVVVVARGVFNASFQATR